MSLERSYVETKRNKRSKGAETGERITISGNLPSSYNTDARADELIRQITEVQRCSPEISHPSSIAQKASSSTKQWTDQLLQLPSISNVLVTDAFPVREAKESRLFLGRVPADPRIHQKRGLLSTDHVIDLKEHDPKSTKSPSSIRNLEVMAESAVTELDCIVNRCDEEREKKGAYGTTGIDSGGSKNTTNCAPKEGYDFSSDDHDNVKDSNSSVSRSGLSPKHSRIKSKTSLEGLHPQRLSSLLNKSKLAGSRRLSPDLPWSEPHPISSHQLQTAPRSKNEAEGPNEGNDQVSLGIETEEDERSSSRQSHSPSNSRLRTDRSRSYRNRTDEGRTSSVANYHYNQRGGVRAHQNPYFDPHFHIAQLQYSWWLQAHAQATNIWMFNNANRGGRSNGNAMNSGPGDSRRDFAFDQSQRRLTREGAPVEDRTQTVHNSQFSYFNEDIGFGLPRPEHDQYFFDPLRMRYPPLMQMYSPGQFQSWQQQQQTNGHQYFNNPNNSSLKLPMLQQQQLAQHEERHTLDDLPLPAEVGVSFIPITNRRGPKNMDDASTDQKLKVMKRTLSSSSKRGKVESMPSVGGHTAANVVDIVPEGANDDGSESNIGNPLGSDEKMTSFKHKTASSRYKGVLFVKNHNKWRAQLCHKGKKVYLGSHHSQEEAAKARDEKVFELFGYKATMLNFPQNFVTRTRGAKESSATRKMT